jgi:predicted  nucleic acid-binding Zn-ribbon protein
MPRLFLLLAAAALTRAAIAQNANATAAPDAGATAPSQTPMQMFAPECWGTEDRSRSFSGTMTTNGGAVVEQIGRRGSERVVQKAFGALRVCMVTHGFDGEPDDRPSRWPLRSDGVILETRMADDVRTLDIDRGRVTYTVNGAVQPLDGAAREWRDNLLGLLDPSWDLAQVRGRVSSLRGEISAIQGVRSSLEGQISSYRGQVSSMHGEISSLRGRVSSMQWEISAIRGHESSLRGAISSERAAVSTLRGMSRENARGIDVDGRIRRHEDNVQRLERRIRDFDADARVREVERRIDAFDVESKVAEVQRRIRDFDVEAKVARPQRLLDGLGVDDRVNRIEHEIRAMDDPARSRELEERRDDALAKLKRTLRLRE